MDQRDFYTARFGDVIDFGTCLVGATLNLVTVRGYGRLDELAAISAPDIFDQQRNPNGTQRNLNRPHAKACFDYAMNSLSVLAEESPRCFPEILLNARDANVVELYNLDEPDDLVDVDSFSSLDDGPLTVGLRVHVAALEFPKKAFDPQISRVDGNHRLYTADEVLVEAAESDTELETDFPYLGFCLLVNLEDLQEATLFRDINGEQRGMEVAHLDSIVIRTAGAALKDDPKKRALWIANELAQPGRAWEGMVFFGGDPKGVREALGYVPPITINALKSTIDTQIRSAPTLDAGFKTNPESLVTLFDRFWKAVKETFPEAWGNKRDYILLQAIGLGAFARFGGKVLEDCLRDRTYNQEDFARHLRVVKGKVPLERDAEMWKGVAGAGGQKVVADQLINAAQPEEVRLEEIKSDLAADFTVDDLLDEAEQRVKREEREERDLEAELREDLEESEQREDE